MNRASIIIFRHLILFLLILGNIQFMAQTDKGWDVPKAVSTTPLAGSTYGLIIGVSQYKNLPSQLKYADKDASVFYSYLIAKGVPQTNIHLLLNEAALKGSIWAEIEYLVDVAKKGDVVYVYFSGHGDVERKTIGRKAYLLPYDSESHGYVSCAVGIPDLKDYFGTLSSHGVQLIFIGDACRVGNLVGGLEGISATAALLQEQWTDEVKILSCQPGQLSQESKQWGNGRGLFSFELINGLAGNADRNKNGEVTLRELELYLMEKVPEAADPNKQDPIVETTNKDFVISFLTPQITSLASSQSSNLIAAVDMKGSESLFLTGMNDSIVKWYQAFQQCMDEGNYLKLKKFDPQVDALAKSKGLVKEGNQTKSSREVREVLPSAFYYYTRIPKVDSTAMLTAYMKRNLSAGLYNHISDFSHLMTGDTLASKSTAANSQLSLRDAKDLIILMGEESSALKELVGPAKLKKLGFYSNQVFIETTGNLVLGNEKKILGMASALDSAIYYTPDMRDLNRLRGTIANLAAEKNKTLVSNASQYYKKEIELDPRYFAAFDDLVFYYYSTNQLDSLEAYTRQISSAVSNTDPFYANFLLAYSFEQTNKPDSTERYLSLLKRSDLFLTRSQNDNKLLYALSELKAVHGACDDAKYYYDIAQSLGYVDTSPPEEQAYCFAAADDKGKANYYIEECINKFAEVDHYKMGRCYALIGEQNKSKEQFALALKQKGKEFYSNLSKGKNDGNSGLRDVFDTTVGLYNGRKAKKHMK